MPQDSVSRRDLLKASAAVGAAAVVGHAQQPAPTTRPTVTIGMATSVAPLARGDVGPILDDMQSRAGVNAIFPFIYTHVPNRAGVPANTQNFHGGNYATPHMQYYKDQPLTFEDMRGMEFGEVDVFAKLIPEAKGHVAPARVIPLFQKFHNLTHIDSSRLERQEDCNEPDDKRGRSQ